MIGTDTQQRSFQDRLKRISKGGENTTRHVHFGPVEEATTGHRVKSRKITIRDGNQRSIFGELFMVPFALLAGMSTVLAARAVGFHFLTDVEQLKTTVAGVGGHTFTIMLIALVLFVLFRKMFGLKGGARGKAVVVGLIAMALFEDLAIVRAPDIFAMIYSPAYVTEVITTLATRGA